jgi:hypothetical protein
MVDDGARESEILHDFNLTSTLNILQLFHEVTTIIIAAPICETGALKVGRIGEIPTITCFLNGTAPEYTYTYRPAP